MCVCCVRALCVCAVLCVRAVCVRAACVRVSVFLWVGVYQAYHILIWLLRVISRLLMRRPTGFVGHPRDCNVEAMSRTHELCQACSHGVHNASLGGCR